MTSTQTCAPDGATCGECWNWEGGYCGTPVPEGPGHAAATDADPSPSRPCAGCEAWNPRERAAREFWESVYREAFIRALEPYPYANGNTGESGMAYRSIQECAEIAARRADAALVEWRKRWGGTK